MLVSIRTTSYGRVMSLFKISFCWSTQCPDTENHYDINSLLCARFGMSDQEKDYLVVGSQTGFLSIFYPHIDWETSDKGGGFSVTDLLLETKLKNPILGIYAGKLNCNIPNKNIQLAVLHPNSLVIYNLQIITGVAEHGSQACLNVLVEHFFNRAAFAFCMGHFGKIKGREFYCIVHLDGTLTFYEQDGISYECRFPGYRSLPTPVVYCERTDSFVRIGAAWTLDCYTERFMICLVLIGENLIEQSWQSSKSIAYPSSLKKSNIIENHGNKLIKAYSGLVYQDLSHSSINKSSYEPAWSVCLGEGILDLTVLQTKQSSSSIIILGEQNLMCLNDSGKLEFILRLDYSPKCFYSFVVGYYWEPDSRLITVIISESSKVHIYEDANLIWTAQLQEEAPVAIKRSNLNNLSGGIVILGATGQLAVGYLGSELFTFTVSPSIGYNYSPSLLNFQEAYRDLVQLEEEIKESIDIDYTETVNQRTTVDLLVNFDIDPKISSDFDGLLMDVPADIAVLELPSCKGILKFKCRNFFSEMQIAFNMPPGIRCSQETATYSDIGPGTTKTFILYFFMAELLHVQSARVDVLISVINTMGIPRVVFKTSYLPLEMFFKPILPPKTASIKLTFNIESEMFETKLNKFFPEFINEQMSDPHVLGLAPTFPVNSQSQGVTVVAAKNTNRIRVKSDTLEMFPLILERLISIIRANPKIRDSNKDRRNANNTVSKNTLSIRSGAYIPSHEILQRIDKHREMQESIKNQSILMDDLWAQFRSLQRKLQEQPEEEPQESLVIQIEQNYDNLIVEGDKLIEMRNKEKRQGSNLSSAIALSNMIISCLPINNRIVNITSAILCTPIEDWTQMSWEESMSPGISMLHHYGLLDRFRSTLNFTDGWNTLTEFFDYGRFRRHFATLFDRIVYLSAADTTTESQIMDSIAENSHFSDLINFEVSDCFNEDNLKILNRNIKEDNTKEFSPKAVKNNEAENNIRNIIGNAEIKKSTLNSETTDWVNENFQLPSSEELFNDLGIWW